MASFAMGGDVWRVLFVEPTSSRLIDRTDNIRLATTDPEVKTVYISKALEGAMLTRVLIHEMGHCAMVSYGLLPELHKLVKPWRRREAEEWVCNFLADFGMRIFQRASHVLGKAAIDLVPDALGGIAANGLFVL